MSEQMLERLRDHNRMISRLEEIESYLDNTGRKSFTVYEVQKIAKYIRLGGGWL